MSLKIAIAQFPSVPGRVKENTGRMIQIIEAAKKQKAALVVFPELAIPGYLVMDLCFNKSFLEEQRYALERICTASKGIAVIAGYIRDAERSRPGGRPALFNSAAFLHDGRLLGSQDKKLLPDYDIFDEHRYFLSGEGQQVFSLKGKQIGIGICEDLWSKGYERNPLAELKALGAELLVNISASPYEVGKFEQRYQVMCDVAAEHRVPLIYANLVGSYDGFDGEVVFDGRSIAMAPSGSILAVGKAFEEDLVVCDPFDGQEIAKPQWSEIEEIFTALATGIRFYFSRHSFRRAFVGISGGVDSAVVAAIAAHALGRENVTGVTMPSRYSSDATRSDAIKLAGNLGIEFKNFPVEKPFVAMLELMKDDPAFAALPEDITEENIQPRLRMAILYALANKFGGIVLNTGNKTELALGYCTIYGDMAGGLGVLADLNKERVYELAHYINAQAGKDLIPASIIERPPTAELKPGQLDEQGMGASPQALSLLVDALVNGVSLREAKKAFRNDHEELLIERTWKTLHANEWKRRQASPGIRISRNAFGHGRRMPMAHDFMG